MNAEETSAVLDALGISAEAVSFLKVEMSLNWCAVTVFDASAEELGSVTRDNPDDPWEVATPGSS